jgi:hypothetical protein
MLRFSNKISEQPKPAEQKAQEFQADTSKAKEQKQG